MSAADWRAAGLALAPLDDTTVLLLIGVAPVPLAAVARGAAGAAGDNRRVAVFDLVGAFGLDDADGLIRAFREGRSLNALARPLDDGSNDRFVVPRGPGVLEAALSTHDRWPKLVGGFRSTGALLILVVPRGLDSIGPFVALADRAFRLVERDGVPGLEPWVVSPPPPLADAQAAVPPAAVQAAASPVDPPPPSARPRSRKVAVIAFAAIVVIAASGWTWWAQRGRARRRVLMHTDSIAAIDASPVRRDTLALPSVVNPEDSARAAHWGVELEATNDRTDANFRLAGSGVLPAGTLSPVLLGGDAAPWFKIVAGAYVDRVPAELLRANLRMRGTLEKGAGVVARVPLALRLDTALTPAVAKARAAAYVTRGIAAYPLLRDDGLVTVYAGAFATPEQAVLLLAELRNAGLKPDLAFRVGRTY